MQLISIAFSDKLNFDFDNLKYKLKNLNDEGIKIVLNRDDCGNIAVYNLKIENNPTFKDINKIRKYVAEMLSDFIVNKIDKKIMKKLINKYYYYFNESEKQEIQKIADGILDDEVNKETFKLIKKEQVFKLIEDFLQENNIIDIEGFVNFRLRDFIGELSEIADRAVDEFMMQKEYNEFIGLLRYFVELQDSKIDTLNIVIEKNGEFRLYDEYNKPIDNDIENEVSIEFPDKGISDEDFLISTLITIAPKKIYIHSINNVKNKEIIETIKKVFNERVEICYGCELCMNKKCKE